MLHARLKLLSKNRKWWTQAAEQKQEVVVANVSSQGDWRRAVREQRALYSAAHPQLGA